MSENKEVAFGCLIWIVLSLLDYFCNGAYCLNWIIGLWWSCLTFAHLPYTVEIAKNVLIPVFGILIFIQVFMDGLFGGSRFHNNVLNYAPKQEDQVVLEGILMGLALFIGFAVSVLIFIVGGLVVPLALLFVVLRAFVGLVKE